MTSGSKGHFVPVSATSLLLATLRTTTRWHMAARVRTLIKSSTERFTHEELLDKEELALACLAHDGGGWIYYEGN